MTDKQKQSLLNACLLSCLAAQSATLAIITAFYISKKYTPGAIVSGASCLITSTVTYSCARRICNKRKTDRIQPGNYDSDISLLYEPDSRQEQEGIELIVGKHGKSR